MVAGARFDRERMAAAASDELIAATDLADLLVKRGHAVPRVPRRRRRARARGGRGGVARWRDVAVPALGAEAAAVLAQSLVAGVQGLRGRHGARARARAARRGARARCDALSVARPPSFYDRPVVEVARDLRRLRASSHGETAGVIVETEAYHHSEPACHAYVGLTAAHLDALRRAGHAPTSTAPTASTPCSTPSASREGVGAAVLDPRARAARRRRRDARAPRRSRAWRTSARARAS